MDLSKIKEVLEQAAAPVAQAMSTPEAKAEIANKAEQKRAATMDKPINGPKSKNMDISPWDPYRGMLFSPEERKETAKEAAKFIDAIDTLYATTPDTHARDKELERIFNYYDYTMPNRVLRDVINELGNAEGLVQRGETLPMSPMEEWKRQRKWLRELLQDPYSTGGGLV